MRIQSAKGIFFFVWKAGLVIGTLSFSYLAIYSPGPGIAPLALKYFTNLIIISVCLYFVARRGERKAERADVKRNE